jgi:PAS domain S-box-containing protein
VNNKYLELIGHRDVLGKPLAEALPEVMGQGFEELLYGVLRTGETFNGFELPIQLQRVPQGPTELRYVDLVYQKLAGVNGHPDRVFAHGIDVTEKVHARKRVEASEKGFREFADAMPHMAFVADSKGAITFFNRRWYEYIQGIDDTEGWGWKDQNIHHPEDLERTIERWNHSLKTGEVYEIEYRLRRYDGVYRWHFGKAIPFKNSDGSIERWIGTNTDIHDFRTALELLSESEDKFRTIADAMPQMVWSTLPDGFHDYYNDRWYEFTGVPPGTTDGEGWNDMFHPEDQEHAWNEWKHSLETGEPYKIEYRLKFRDGSYRWTLGRALPIRKEDGTIVRWMGTCTDIHDIKLNEQHLKDAQTSLEKSLKARDEFLSIASHELKTPLTVLKLENQSLRRRFDQGRLGPITEDKLISMVDTNITQIKKLTRLVDDMLDLTRIQSGKLTFSSDNVLLSVVLKELVARMNHQLLEAGCPVTLNVNSEKTLSVDRFRIEQVFINILTNAMRYAKGAPIEISIDLLDGKERISIKDRGIGIAQENLELVFDRFERAVDANEISGLGLGLYICKQIIAGHGGKIWVESELGKGSTFFIELVP